MAGLARPRRNQRVVFLPYPAARFPPGQPCANAGIQGAILRTRPPVQARGRLWTPAFRGSDDSGDMRLRRWLVYATQVRQFRTEEAMANNSTSSAKTKVIHAGFLLADPDIEPKSEQSI